MDLTNKKAHQIFLHFNTEKVICDIKDRNLRIHFIQSTFWFIPFFITLAIILNWNVFFEIFLDSSVIASFSILLLSIILTILAFLSQTYCLYFSDHYLILENKLNKKKFIDITKYPRIYVRKKEALVRDDYSHSGYEIENNYYLYIEQNDNVIELDIKRSGSRAILSLLGNLEMKTEQECTEEQWNCSVNSKEKLFSKYADFLDQQEKIIDVKNCNDNRKILRGYTITLKILILVLIICSLLIIFGVVNQISSIVIFISLLWFTMLVLLIQQYQDIYLKISYPQKGMIKINKYLLDYQKTAIKIQLSSVQLPTSHSKYEYFLILKGKNTQYCIKLSSAQEHEVCCFIDNLIFKPKDDGGK